MIHRNIDLRKDRGYVLECHCRINWECDSPWKRKTPYASYRNEWFSLDSQVAQFLDALKQTAKDSRTIAEIMETQEGDIVGYLWVPFYEQGESGFCFAEIQDIYIEENFRRAGIAKELLQYAEKKAGQNGAKVIRSGTGCENVKSIKLHEGLGYEPYRYEFEKIILPDTSQ